MCMWFKGSSGVRLETGEEYKGKVRRLNSAIARNVGGRTDALECTLHWTRNFNYFVHVYVLIFYYICLFVCFPIFIILCCTYLNSTPPRLAMLSAVYS